MGKRFLKLITIGLTGGALLTTAVVYTLIPKHDVAFGASHDRRFPNGATDINYNIVRGVFGGWWNADFRISEADFIAYCEGKGWALTPVAGPREFQLGLDPGGDLERRIIDDGLVYQSPIASDGGGVFVVYERSSGRATVRSSSN